MSPPPPSTTLKPIVGPADPESAKPLRRRSSASSLGSARSRRSSSASQRPKVVVSPNRRLLILALRYLISREEYSVVRKKILRRGPVAISSNTPTRAEFDAVVRAAAWDDFLPASSRAGLRVLVLCNVLLNAWDFAVAKLRSRREAAAWVCSLLLRLLPPRRAN